MTDFILCSVYLTHSIISAVIFQLDSHKVCELDGIPVIVIKMCAPQLASLLSKLYIKCLLLYCLMEYIVCCSCFEEL